MTLPLPAAATPSPYWHRYHDAATLARAEALRETQRLVSTGVELHVDVYRQPAADAPLLILNHGGGGHAGLFLGLALAAHARGYTVIVPDQKGQGRSGACLGDFTIGECVQNIVDVAHWARREFGGPLYLAGGSIGGGLTYYAGAALARAGVPPRALACLNLYDFGDPRTSLGFTRGAALAWLPGLARLCRALSRGLARLAPTLRLPYRPLAQFRHMVDDRDLAGGFYERWRDDPATLRTVTAAYFASVMATPPAIAFEDNRLPVLVINQRRDRMVSPQLTRASYERLGGPRAYVEIDWGHFSLQPAFTEEIGRLADDWFRRHAAAGAAA